jgi:ribosomal protein S25
MQALLIYPTHDNCDEVFVQAQARGFSAAVYPARRTKSKDHRPINCWNAEADTAEAMGFPVVKAVCPTCPRRKECQQSGYLGQLMAVQKADVALCTHKRAEYTGLAQLCEGRPYVSIHEDPLHIVRPRVTLLDVDLLPLQVLVTRLLNDPRSLDWFGADQAVDDDGNRYHAAELVVRRERLYEACRQLAALLDALERAIVSAQQLTEWCVPESASLPMGFERLLYGMARAARVSFEGSPWRFLLAAIAGQFVSAAIQVHRKPPRNGRPEIVSKAIVGFRHNAPPLTAVTWFNDATGSAQQLEQALGRPVQVRTPSGRIDRQRKAVQIPRDISRGTSPRVVASLLRGVLADRPQFQRIGLIGHRPHLGVIDQLEPEYRQRFVMRTYFGSGDDRSSNAWHEQCDLIIVAGTPRVPPEEIERRLVQTGAVDAACRRPRWGSIAWTGVTENGEAVTVSGRGYHDDAWRRAHESLVRAALVQAIGRGRGILEAGCEVLVLSNEECGLPLSDGSVETLNQSSVRVLAALRELTMENPIKRLIENSIVSTSTIASAVGLSVVHVRELLRALEQRGLVQKVGERSGWRLVATEEAACPV